MRRIKSHTTEKLAYFNKYIEAYLVATKRLPAKYYIDAFAGSGRCILCDKKCKSRGGSKCQKCGKGKLLDGSAMMSLKTNRAFSKYIFIELNKNLAGELKELTKRLDQELQDKIKIINSDANVVLKEIHRDIPEYVGCLFFLDPEGPELEWETIESLAKIKKADLLILYPYDMALVRLTSNYKEKLNKFYGDDGWIQLYENEKNFNAEKRRDALLDLYTERLEKLGFKYVVCKTVRRRLRSGKSLYHLILATHHPAGEKIIQNIFNKELDGQQKFKF